MNRFVHMYLACTSINFHLLYMPLFAKFIYLRFKVYLLISALYTGMEVEGMKVLLPRTVPILTTW